MKLSADTYFYVPPENVGDKEVIFTPEEAGHILRVWRLSDGAMVVVTDGEGKLYDVVLRRQKKRGLRGEIVSIREAEDRLSTHITLGLGLVSSSRLEPVIDICTQVGVSAFWFFRADRLGERWSAERVNAFTARVKRVMVSSIKQCKASILPHIYPVCELDELLRMRSGFDFIAYGDPFGLPGLAGLGLSAGLRYLLLVGPAGDFSPREKELLAQLKAIPISLGRRRLRTESAAMVFAVKLLSFLKEI